MTTPPKREARFPLRLDQLQTAAQRPVATLPASAQPARPPLARTPVGGVAHQLVRASSTPVNQRGPLGAAAGKPPIQAAQRPTGLGLDSADVRRRMVARLRADGVKAPAVLEAMNTVPRHLFVDAALVTQAYEDTSLPIGHGQTISKPSVVARMIDLLMDGSNARSAQSLGKVLEIGTGCGYQAALLCLLGRSVISVERLKPLHDKARDLLEAARSTRLRLVYGDGMLGHAPNAPYDSIISAAGGDAVPQAWLDQLAIGGRLVSPVRQPGTERQMLVVVDRSESGYTHHIHEAVNFVPLKSGMIR
jgi:protein-L-isoaspartate(D-aspartate) O-methyltransferase